MRAALDEAGLRATSAHVRLESLQTQLSTVISEAKQLGVTHIGVPWIKSSASDPSAPLSLAEADAAVSTFKSICKPLRTAGIHLSLHNHGYEAVATGGPTMLDRILASFLG
jgi:hypothetical protein